MNITNVFCVQVRFSQSRSFQDIYLFKSVKYVTKIKRSMADECKQIAKRRTCRLCLGYVADAHILAGFGVVPTAFGEYVGN